MALVQRGEKDTDVPNHLVMLTSRLNSHASVCEEVRNIMRTRGTLVNTAQPMDTGALDKGTAKGKARRRRVTMSKARRKASRERGEPTRESEGEPRQRCAVLLLREESTQKNATVANVYVIREVVRKPSRKTRRLQVVKHTTKGKTPGFSRLDWTHSATTATRKETACSSTLAQQSRHGRHSSVKEQPRDPLPMRCPRGIWCNDQETRRDKQSGINVIDVNFQVADVPIAVRDLTSTTCEKSISPRMERVDSLREVSKTWLHDAIAPLEVSLIRCCQLTTTEGNTRPTCQSNFVPSE